MVQQHETVHADLAVIGSGGAAFAAAIAARRKDKTVVMIEQGTVGGTCVNTGCVPSKALLAAAEARHVADRQAFPGIRTEAGPVDMATLIAGKAGLVEQLRADKYVDLAAEYDWPILTGRARFTDGPALEISLDDGSTQRLEAEHYLIATGSTPTAPPIPGLADAGYLTSTTALELDALPASLVVVGGNYIGLEMAQLFARLGTQVTVVEVLDRLAPLEEPEISDVIAGVFADEGITVHTATNLTAVERDESGYTLTGTTADTDNDGAVTARAEQLLVATGRRPVTAGLDLDTVGVKTGPRGEVVVDEHLRTHNPRIWAAGDVTGHPQFVYIAGAHGSLVADNAFDHAGRTLDYHHLPRVTFTTPNIAAVGLTDAQAIEQSLACEFRVLPLEYVPRALVNRDTRGLIKIVAEQGTGRIVGISAIAAAAGEVIAAGVYVIANQMTTSQVAELWSPYLTMAEGLKLAAQTFTRDVAKLSCCAS
ncbi:MAG: mercury(II) reductase [Streptosporangiales bacterium]|nr:mercury(II) reductase [Streptosporangiales bacterium]